MTRTAHDIHKSFAANVTFGKTILWDIYRNDQLSVFREKLNQLFPKPGTEKGDKAVEKVRQNVYINVISQTKYTNKNLLTGFVLVTVAEGTTFTEAKNATKFSIHLVVRTRKCIKDGDSTGCCMAYVDECGNVYKNWQHFIETNSLPSGVAYAPSNGIYLEEENLEPIMDAWATPASGLGSQILKVSDITAGVAGFGAAGVVLAAICSAPIAAPLLVGASAVAVGTGAYSACRSICQLWDKADHEQSIAPTDSEARGAWIGIASGVTSVFSVGANAAITRLAASGRNISLIEQTIVNGLNISTMLFSGVGIGNGVLDMILKYADDEQVTALDMAQLAASLVIFTHSVYNFRLASTMVQQAQNSRVNAYRNELSGRQRRMFDKLTKETVRTRGNARGKADVIRLINEVPDNQYLNDLNKINKDLNKNNVRFSAGRNGEVILNGELAAKPVDLRSNIQHGKGESILGKVTQPIPESHPNARVETLTNAAYSTNSSSLVNFCEQIFAVTVINSNALQSLIQLIIDLHNEDIAFYLMQKAKQFTSLYAEKILQSINIPIPYDTVLWDLYNHCKKVVQNFTIEQLDKVINSVFETLYEFYNRMSIVNRSIQPTRCPTCGGFYQICPID